MTPIPREDSLDSSLALLSEGYTFVSSRCERYGTDIFETRLMLTRAICMLGEEAARIFYDADRFTRKNALPVTALTLLLDKGSVALLDGDAHRWRKKTFMSLMTPASIDRLVNAVDDRWRVCISHWEEMDEVVLHGAVQDVLCYAVCEWAGIPLAESEVKRRTREFAAMIDGAGAVGPRNWWGQYQRARTEDWVRHIIEDVRSGNLAVPTGSAAQAVALHRDLDGELLDPEVGAVELINLLRPTVAVARFVTFAALALHQHPDSRQRLQAGDEDYLQHFVQEIRRFYPFFPLVGGRVKQEFQWRGHHFDTGTWVLLDLYGTNHDRRIWGDPETFRPERFRDWNGSPFNFIPQGGGDHFSNHRCAGEWITVALMKRAVHLLVTAMRYGVPEQDLRISLSRMPAIPQSGFVINKVGRIH